MIPEYDWDLHRFLTEMWERDHNHLRFYNSASWRRLRARVLEEFHWESQDELLASPAKYVRADVVHHDRYVDKYPGWALSEFWVDKDGAVRRNLVPLSHDAHEARHSRGRYYVRPVIDTLTPERW